MHKKFLVTALFSALIFAACNDDSGVSSQKPCNSTVNTCVGNSVQTCKEGVLQLIPCPESFTCDNGLCNPDNIQECDSATTQPSCAGDMLAICENNQLRYNPCPAGLCRNNSCVECEEDQKSCVGMNTRKYCDQGILKTETCTGDGICQNGVCIGNGSGCGNGVKETGEFCDDGTLNGTYGKCRSDCQSISSCGDGIVDIPDEECEPSADSQLKLCADNCKYKPTLFGNYPSRDTVQKYIKGQLDQCTEDDLFTKYLYYRRRFIGDPENGIPGFVYFGYDRGESIPASARDNNSTCKGHWKFGTCEFEDLPDAQGFLNFGDSTIWLGTMIHWLATEWKVFHELGIPTHETEQLIYYAFKAFDRLDTNAEALFGFPAKLDGFFLRDDIPRDFFKKSDGSYRFIRTDDPYSGYECAGSGISCALYRNDSVEQQLDDGSFVSQDQITGLFEGYAMIVTLLPNDVIVEGMNLRHYAMETMARILGFLEDHTWLLGMEINGVWKQIPKDWGGYAQLFSGMFAGVLNHSIKGELGVDDYQDAISQAAYSNTDSYLNVIWSGWEVNNNYNRNLALRLLAHNDIWDEEKMINMCISSGRDIFALAYALAHENPISDSFPLWEMHQILATAPCDGPCSGGESCPNPVPGWMGENYFITPRDRLGYDSENVEYNGLDYLIGHNLYMLNYMKKFGHSYTQILPDIPDNQETGVLSGFIQNGTAFTTFDPSDPKNKGDIHMKFCSKPLADWIRDAAERNVEIYSGKNIWTCTRNMQCELSSSPNIDPSKNALVIGTNRKDTFNITTSRHVCIVTFDGDDDITFNGGSALDGGTTVIEAGNGNNKVTVKKAKSIIYTGNGNDTINATGGMQFVVSGDGNDDITTGDKNDIIDSGPGNDTIHAGHGHNTINAGPGKDTIYSGNNNSQIRPGDGDDRVWVGNGNNTIIDDNGNTFVIAGDGVNKVIGEYLSKNKLYMCLGSGKNDIWGGWTNTCRSNDAPNTDFHNNTCPGTKLSDSDCTEDAFNAWF